VRYPQKITHLFDFDATTIYYGHAMQLIVSILLLLSICIEI
jgi:hypothetical protein